jgi:hypothetical protein
MYHYSRDFLATKTVCGISIISDGGYKLSAERTSSIPNDLVTCEKCRQTLEFKTDEILFHVKFEGCAHKWLAQRFRDEMIEIRGGQ